MLRWLSAFVVGGAAARTVVHRRGVVSLNGARRGPAVSTPFPRSFSLKTQNKREKKQENDDSTHSKSAFGSRARVLLSAAGAVGTGKGRAALELCYFFLAEP
jgi:hypothetical protein